MNYKLQNSPKLRFPEFEGEWKVDELGNNAKVTSGGTPSRNKKNFWNGNIPWITTSLINFNVINTAEEFITQDAVLKSSAKLFPKGTILMAMYGQGKTRGKVAVLGLDATTNQACAAILPNDDLDKIYLFQNLAGRYDEIRDLSNEGGQQNLSGGIIKGIKISFPTLPEQQKIASFLSAVDEKIQQLSRKKELLSQYKKGVMQQLFSGKLRFKDENGKDYDDWDEKTFGNIFSFYTTNSLSRENLNYDDGEVKNIHYGDIHTKFKTLFDINNELVPFINSDFNVSKIKNECYCQEGDLVIADASEDYADIGKSIEIINIQNEKIVAGLHTFLARPNKTKMYVGFSGYIVRSDTFRKQIMTIAQGSKVLSISTGRLAMVKMKIPCVQEQQKIANFLSSIDTKIESTSQQINQTQSFKKGLLQQLFV